MSGFRAWGVLVFGCALTATGACSDDKEDPRRAEIWMIDFQTHQAEVSETIEELALPAGAVIDSTLEWLRLYFDGLPIHLQPGAPLDGEFVSAICLRHGVGSDEPFALGIFDPGNSSAVHVCGDRNGNSFGVFINQIADSFTAQIEKDAPEARRIEVFSRMLAVVIAHEIGHGVGLGHSTGDFGFGDIMRPPPLSIIGEYAFSEPARAQLQANLAR